MRNAPPPPIFGFRWLLLVVAITALCVGFVVLAFFRHQPSVPVAPLVATAGIIFLWANGGFWWLEFRYPLVQIEPNKYASRFELGSVRMKVYLDIVLGAYGVGTLLATVACIRVAAGG